MENYFKILAVVGVGTLYASFLPIPLKKYKVSFTLPLLIIGILLYILNIPLPWLNSTEYDGLALRFSEFIVIISLMVAGLKIGLNYTFKEWLSPFGLIGITMPLFIILIYFSAKYILNLPEALSLLLAAALAPTDPALASEIQLNEKQDINSKSLGVRYHLTAEAGLNDGLAFPFVFLAILWSENSEFKMENLWQWVGYYVFYKIIIGILIGMVIGYCYSYMTYKISKKYEKSIHLAFVAISLTLISYSLAELADSYGFLSVFFCGLFAHYHKHVKQKDSKSEPNLGFIEHIEKFLIIVWMIIIGGLIFSGVFNYLTLNDVLFSLIVVVIARPILGYLGLYRSKLNKRKKLIVSFLGIRGIGSIFYFTYALEHGDFANTSRVYAIILLIILISIVMHGLSAKQLMT